MGGEIQGQPKEGPLKAVFKMGDVGKSRGGIAEIGAGGKDHPIFWGDPVRKRGGATAGAKKNDGISPGGEQRTARLGKGKVFG